MNCFLTIEKDEYYVLTPRVELIKLEMLLDTFQGPKFKCLGRDLIT